MAPSKLHTTSPDDVARRFARLSKEAAQEVRQATARREEELAREAVPASARGRTGPRRLVWYGAWAAMVILLPIVSLVGGAGWLYRAGMPTIVALVLAGLSTVGILTLYGATVSRALTGRLRLRFVGLWLAVPVVVAYAAFALLYLSSVNAKSDEVRAYYRVVHPMLRLAVATATLADDGLVVTDAYRVPEDYAAMGLPLYENSLHFRQADGYVHAMDLRTIGRSEIRNWAMVAYFRLLGFQTLRHVGTADHLHVSLPFPSARDDTNSG